MEQYVSSSGILESGQRRLGEGKRQIDRLVVAAAEDLFLGVTAQNVGERVRTRND